MFKFSSQTALHLYQELFKIYKYSFHQQQQLQQLNNENTLMNLINFKQIESSAIEYIWKLAFKSSNRDVSLAAIQFLNSHYAQPDTIASAEHETQFIESCMGYLNEASNRLQTIQSAGLSGKFTQIKIAKLKFRKQWNHYYHRYHKLT